MSGHRKWSEIRHEARRRVQTLTEDEVTRGIVLVTPRGTHYHLRPHSYPETQKMRLEVARGSGRLPCQNGCFEQGGDGRTGAERYLAERLRDPEYRAHYEEARRG